jgi:hypothetical protein
MGREEMWPRLFGSFVVMTKEQPVWLEDNKIKWILNKDLTTKNTKEHRQKTKEKRHFRIGNASL